MGGNAFTAVMDMTGGIVENKNYLTSTILPHLYDQCWTNFLELFNKKSMMGCMLPKNVITAISNRSGVLCCSL